MKPAARSTAVPTAPTSRVTRSLPTAPASDARMPIATPQRAEPSLRAVVTLCVNGVEHTLELDTRTSLLDLLRERLGLTGSKKGSDHGESGACTILLEGRRAAPSLALAVAHRGADIVTVEGLADGDGLHPLQQAFVEHDAF